MCKNNRQHPRYPFFANAVTCIRKNGRVRHVSGMVNNISPWGLGIRSYSPLRKNMTTCLDLVYINSRGMKEEDSVEGKVVWTSRRGDIYYAGILFNHELNPASQPNLFHHFNSFIRRD